MTLAAIYARFSSDSQRDESIDIQVERCTQLIEREKWVLGDIYTDYAMTGTNDERPGFKRCVADGAAGAYDVLVIYKHDRFARNVEVSRKYKRKLRSAGVRIVSVREGESKDTPDGFLHEGLDELFAEYYSRNLSVLIRDGMRKNAENRRASGHRVFGYRVDENDRFAIDEDTAPVVEHLFKSYLAGQSVNQLADWMKSQGLKTRRGNWWSPQSVNKVLKNDAYRGVYRFNGIVDYEDGMPAIIDAATFQAVQDKMASRQMAKRRKNVNEYLLTDKLYCLECGHPMGGDSGTGKSGTKYTYYKCRLSKGCGLRVPQETVEDAVIGSIKEMLHDSAVTDLMVESAMDYVDSLPDRSAELEAERKEAVKRRDNLISSIAEGIPPATVKDAIAGQESRIEELDSLIAREGFNKKLLDEDSVRSFIGTIIDTSDSTEEKRHVILETFVDKIYVDRECVITLFKLGAGQQEFDLSQLKAIKEAEPSQTCCSEGVRLTFKWWSIGGSNP